MNSVTKNRLIDLGWKEQRRINTDMIRKKYYEIGLDYPEVVDKFLKEYVRIPLERNSLHASAGRLSAPNGKFLSYTGLRMFLPFSSRRNAL